MREISLNQGLPVAGAEWVSLPGGELEVPRPRARCAACRVASQRLARASGVADGRPACLACYRADVARTWALKAAAQFDTATLGRFQEALPFAPVNRPRLDRLRAARLAARRDAGAAARYADRRRSAQLAARLALQRLGEGLRGRRLDASQLGNTVSRVGPSTMPVTASWLPLVACPR